MILQPDAVNVARCIVLGTAGEASSEITGALGLHQPVSCVWGTRSVWGLHTQAKVIASPPILCKQKTHTHTHTHK